MADWKLDGKTALITGAARGIGLGTSKALAERGVRVAMLDIDAAELETAAASVPNAIAFSADVTDRDGLRSAIDEAAGQLGGLDIVMANAGIAPAGLIRSIDEEVFERTIDVNVTGVWRTVRYSIEHVIERRGYVLPVASLAAVTGGPMLGSYGPTKAAVESFANQLRAEVAFHGVDVGCAYFAFIDTDMVRGGFDRDVYRLMRSRMKGPVAKTSSLDTAVAAVMRGMESRSRLVYAPRWVRGAIAGRALVTRFAEREAVKHLPDGERAFEEEIAREGREAASAPTGAGGVAGMRKGVVR